MRDTSIILHIAQAIESAKSARKNTGTETKLTLAPQTSNDATSDKIASNENRPLTLVQEEC